jgi:hypothetical protein
MREKAKEILNWKRISEHLSGSDNSIRKNKVPKKYQDKVNELIDNVINWLE